MAYDQFLAVMLTATGVILTALALVVGLVAVFGYQKISEIAAEEARKSALTYLDQFLGGTGSSPKRRISASKRKTAGKVQKGITATASAEINPTNSADKKTVAQRYPKGGK